MSCSNQEQSSIGVFRLCSLLAVDFCRSFFPSLTVVLYSFNMGIRSIILIQKICRILAVSRFNNLCQLLWTRRSKNTTWEYGAGPTPCRHASHIWDLQLTADSKTFFYYFSPSFSPCMLRALRMPDARPARPPTAHVSSSIVLSATGSEWKLVEA